MVNMFSQNVKYNLLKYSLRQFCLHPHPVHSSGESWEPPVKIVIKHEHIIRPVHREHAFWHLNLPRH